MSLSSLPLELKSLVVDKIAEIGHLPLDRSDRDADATESETDGDVTDSPKALADARLRQMPLRAMSLVSREFAALAEPHLWSSVKLGTYDARNISHVLAELLPRHGRHITSLDICEVGRIDVSYEIESSFKTTLAKPIPAHEDPVILAQQLLLLALAIEDMPNLCAVSCMASQLSNAACTRDKIAPVLVKARGQVEAALAFLGTRLVDLRICDDGLLIPADPNRYASFLSHFTSLSSLSLIVRARGGDSLLSTISSMRHLTELDIGGMNFINDAFAAAAWICPLEKLSLSEGLSLPSFHCLLSNFSATLKALTLRRYAGRHVKPTTHAISKPFPLPHLRMLDISADQADLFASFSFCPLQYITIEEEGPDVDLPKCLAFVESHAETLKCVTVDAWMSIFARPSPLLRELCELKGIDFVAEGVVDDVEEEEEENDAADAAAFVFRLEAPAEDSEAEEDGENE